MADSKRQKRRRRKDHVMRVGTSEVWRRVTIEALARTSTIDAKSRFISAKALRRRAYCSASVARARRPARARARQRLTFELSRQKTRARAPLRLRAIDARCWRLRARSRILTHATDGEDWRARAVDGCGGGGGGGGGGGDDDDDAPLFALARARGA